MSVVGAGVELIIADRGLLLEMVRAWQSFNRQPQSTGRDRLIATVATASTP
jgi:hypothetical protein